MMNLANRLNEVKGHNAIALSFRSHFERPGRTIG